jgi:hypothetical protein
MRSCLVMGSGRSGTSLLAGMIIRAGYFGGDTLWPANSANPKGFYEDAEVNGINERLLEPVTDGGIRQRMRRTPPAFATGQRWLAQVPVDTTTACANGKLTNRIVALTEQRPFCLKDPRFCYTLPSWRPFVADAAFLCIFREPSTTVRSILRECAEREYLASLQIDETDAYAVWTLMYRHILEKHRPEGDWLFLHYDQLIDGSRVHRLEELLGSSTDASFAESALRRSQPDPTRVPHDAVEIYEQLCELAEFTS